MFGLLLFPGIISGQPAATDVRENENSSMIIGAIEIEGNKVTHESIIYRELMFRKNDTTTFAEITKLIEKSRENLINTSLFNFVNINTKVSGPESINVKVKVTERWYIWPWPILKISDRNFNVWWQTKELRRLSYGFRIDWQNVRGRMENLMTTFQFGYDQVFEFYYRFPYLNKKKTVGLGLGAGIASNHEVNYKTEYNKQQFFRLDDDYSRRDIYAFVNVSIRPSIYNSHSIQLRFDKQNFIDTLVVSNPYYSDGDQHKDYFSVYYKYKSDHRDYKPYPLRGYYFDIEMSKMGLWFFNDNTVNFFSVGGTFRKFWEIGGRFYYAVGLNAKFSDNGRQPYFLVKGIGYGRNVIRGYEYYVIDGQSFGIIKNNLKFAILPRTVRDIKFIKSDKFGLIHFAFYMNLFFDIGYVDNNQYYGENMNTMENELQYGYGLGIDFVSYYDIVLRMEYSFNKKGDSGFFLHFMAPI
jgi:hypothetical protein